MTWVTRHARSAGLELPKVSIHIHDVALASPSFHAAPLTCTSCPLMPLLGINCGVAELLSLFKRQTIQHELQVGDRDPGDPDQNR